jgi:hypothetical protein
MPSESVQQFGAGLVAGLVVGIPLLILFWYKVGGSSAAKELVLILIAGIIIAILIDRIGHTYYPHHWFIKGVDDFVAWSFKMIDAFYTE